MAPCVSGANHIMPLITADYEKYFIGPYENYPILIYDMTIISLVVYTGVYP